MFYCPFCGAAHDISERICRNCGNDLSSFLSTVGNKSNAQVEINPSVITNQPSGAGLFQGISVIYIKWNIFETGNVMLYDPSFKPMAEFRPIIGEKGLEYHLFDLQGQLLLRIKQRDFTHFDIFSSAGSLGQIEERLMKEEVEFLVSPANRIMVSDLGHFVKRRSINSDDNGRTISIIGESKEEEIPPALGIRNCYTLQIKNRAYNILQIFAFNFYHLIRYR